jgi:ubiquitin carboxyl-terminal hydrolase 5/13
VIHAKKFQLVNWVPTKLDIPISLPLSDILNLDEYIGKGLQDTEVELPEESPGKEPLLPCWSLSGVQYSAYV